MASAFQSQPVRVTGLKELRNALNAVEPATRRELPKILRIAAAPAAAAAAATAPVGGGDDSHPGQLAGSTRIKVTARGAAIGSPLVYAPVINFGRKAQVSGGKVAAHTRHLTPSPYIPMAIDREADAIETLATQGIQALLDKLVATGGDAG